MRISVRIAAAILVAAVTLPSLASSAPRVLTVDQWRSDLDSLAAGIAEGHRNPFHTATREDFDRAVVDLRTRIPNLDDHEVILGLARITAMVGDGHTRLTFHHDPTGHSRLSHAPVQPPREPELAFHHLPVRLEWFEDGLFVRAATAEHRELIGSQVLRFGSVAADSAISRVRPLIARDNDSGLRLYVGSLLSVPEVLHALRLAADPSGAALTLRDRKGQTREVRLTALQPHPPAEFVDGAALAGELPLWQRNTERAFWTEFLEPSRTLYVPINRIGPEGDMTLSAFTARLDSVMTQRRPERLVIDLRHNSGGNNSLNRSLILTLVRRNDVNRYGRLFAITGPKTFSAAQNLVNDLEHLSEVLFVGEPTGASPSGYGDARRITLHHSGLVLRVSTIYWRDWTGNELRPWTAPDLPAAMTSTAFFAGRDPALEAAIAFQPAATPAARVEQMQKTGGRTSAVRVIYRTLTDPSASAADRAAVNEAYGKLAGE